MFEQLKKQSMKSAMIRILACVVIIVIVLVVTKDSLIKMYEGPKYLDDLGMDELKGAYVNADIYAIYSNFAEYYETDEYGNETSLDQYYIIPVGDEEFIGLQINSDDAYLASQIYDETYQYYNGEIQDLTTVLPVKGSINKMDDEAYQYYKEWFQTSGYLENPTQEEIERIALPYILQVDYIGGYEDYVVYIAIAAMALFLFGAIFMLVKCITGMYVSDIKKFIRKNESYVNDERLEMDYQCAAEIEKVHVGKIGFYYFKGSSAKILANKEIIWAYLENVTHRTYGIKTGVSKYLIIYTKDKKVYRIPMKKVDSVNSVLNHLSQNHPHIVIGYSEELKRCYRKDFNAFLNLNTQNTEFTGAQF